MPMIDSARARITLKTVRAQLCQIADEIERGLEDEEIFDLIWHFGFVVCRDLEQYRAPEDIEKKYRDFIHRGNCAWVVHQHREPCNCRAI